MNDIKLRIEQKIVDRFEKAFSESDREISTLSEFARIAVDDLLNKHDMSTLEELEEKGLLVK